MPTQVLPHNLRRCSRCTLLSGSSVTSASPEGEHMPQVPEPGIDEPRCVRQKARFEAAYFVRPNSLLMYCNIWTLLNGTAGWRPEGIRSRITCFRRLGGIVSPTFHCMARMGSAHSIVDGTKISLPRDRFGRLGSAGTLLQRQIVLDNYSDPLVLFWAPQHCTRDHSRMNSYAWQKRYLRCSETRARWSVETGVRQTTITKKFVYVT
jgi:hypothetical protein